MMSSSRDREGDETAPGADGPSVTPDPPARTRENMLPQRQGRRFAIERALVRLVATGGIIGVGVVLGAVLTSNNVQGWITGLVVAVVSVVLAALLWSSRQL